MYNTSCLTFSVDDVQIYFPEAFSLLKLYTALMYLTCYYFSFPCDHHPFFFLLHMLFLLRRQLLNHQLIAATFFPHSTRVFSLISIYN